MEEINLQDILDSLESTYPGESDDFVIETSLGNLRAIVERGEAYRKDTYNKTRVGLPQFIRGDIVVITGTATSFRIESAELNDHPDYGYCWLYRYSIYYVPEKDLELVMPRTLRTLL